MDKHISSQFDAELASASSRVPELGGLVESQIRHAVYALSQFSIEVADQVIATEKQVNAMEVEIDRELSSIIARRQPTARDLRLLMAISKITANLERAGDESERIARMVKLIVEQGVTRALPASELRVAADLASGLLRAPVSGVMVAGEILMGYAILKSNLFQLRGLRTTLVVWAARRLRRPVKWVATRSESMLTDHCGRETVYYGELALDDLRTRPPGGNQRIQARAAT